MKSISKGFTLIEITLVLLILGLLAGSIVTNMGSGYRGIALETDAKMLADLIYTAERYATANNRVVRLRIDDARQEYSFQIARAPESEFEPAKGELAGVTRLNQGIAFLEVRKTRPGARRDTEVQFSPNGSTEPMLIVLTNGADETYSLSVGELMGPPTLERLVR